MVLADQWVLLGNPPFRSIHRRKFPFWEVMGREAAAAVKDVWPG